MKASELIARLAHQIDAHGDLPVTVDGHNQTPALVTSYDKDGRSLTRGDDNAQPESRIHIHLWVDT